MDSFLQFIVSFFKILNDRKILVANLAQLILVVVKLFFGLTEFSLFLSQSLIKFWKLLVSSVEILLSTIILLTLFIQRS